jgi:predicted GNAT family acetyltransferase
VAEDGVVDNIAIVDEPHARRYALSVGTSAAGHLSYRRDDDLVTVTHTVVLDDFAGRGLAGRLVAYVLADLRTKNLRLLPQCPYVQAYLRKHPQDLDLVPVERRAEFSLT